MAATEADLSIGQAAERVGLPPSTLRYWESAGLLAAPPRVGGKRRYDSHLLRQIEMVTLAKRVGFTLAETRIVLRGFSERTPPPEIWRELASRKLPEVERILAEARAMKSVLEQGLECDCPKLDDCLLEANGAFRGSLGREKP